MSKEIIIDGVDVAGCKNFISVYTEDEDIEINNCCTLTYTTCQFEKKDCYYKQLKRLQAENEELKAKFNNNSLCNKIQIYEADEARIRKALEEIREMCSNTCEKNKDCIHSCYECKSIDEPVAINRILNKINEVLK